MYVSSNTTFGGTKLSGPTGVAVDASGDLFIADTGNNRIVEYSALGAASVVATSGVTLSAPTGVAVLPSGDLIVTDAANDVSLITGGNGSALSISNTGTGTPLTIGKAVGVALDLSGNIYAADMTDDQVIELKISSPATAPGFPTTAPGATSASDDTTAVFNSGNATLSLSAAPALDSGDTNFGILGTGTCTNGATVTASQNCTLVTDFTPQSGGILSGTLTLTDNQLGYTLAATTPNQTASFLASGTQTIALSGTGETLPAAATPTFSPVAGTYASAQTVTLSSNTTPSATFYYTTDGTTPTASSTLYSGSIIVSASETVEAIAVATGYTTSAAGSAAYTIETPAATPTFSPVAGTYASVQTVTISSATPGATIYYTTNGSAPTTSSAAYTVPITVSSSETVEAIAVASSDGTSAVGSATYTINLPQVATPTFSPGTGTYNSAQTVTISSTTPSATIYYTTNGTAPTTGTQIYSAPISISSSETINAIAVASGYTTSTVGTAAYTITLAQAATPRSAQGPAPILGADGDHQLDDAGSNDLLHNQRNVSRSTSSTIYSGPITVSTSERVEAIAVATGYTTSAVGMATYTINLPRRRRQPSAPWPEA